MKPFEALMKGFTEATGLPMQISVDDSCSLETEGMIITMQYRQESDDIVIFAPVMTPDEDETLPNGVLRKALELSYNGKGTHGAFLGLFEGALVLSFTISTHGLNVDILCAHIIAFTETAQGIALELENILAEEGGYEVQNKDDGNGESLYGSNIVLKV